MEGWVGGGRGFLDVTSAMGIRRVVPRCAILVSCLANPHRGPTLNLLESTGTYVLLLDGAREDCTVHCQYVCMCTSLHIHLHICTLPCKLHLHLHLGLPARSAPRTSRLTTILPTPGAQDQRHQSCACMCMYVCVCVLQFLFAVCTASPSTLVWNIAYFQILICRSLLLLRPGMAMASARG